MAKAKKAKKKPKTKSTFEEHELPAEGDVFAFKLKGGRFGACRVLRKLPIGKSGLAEWTSNTAGFCLRVAVSPWIGKKLPALQEPQLREILVLTHHSWEGQKEIYLVTEPPGRAFTLIGNLPRTAAERRQKEVTLSVGDWPKQIWAEQVVMQWEWDQAHE